MHDDQNKSTNSDTDVDERPLDPAGNYADMIGDTQGQTGVTVGSAQQSSAEPSDTITNVDTANLPGGVEPPSGPRTQPTGIPQTAQNDKSYQQSVRQGMSTIAGGQSDDTASVSDTNTPNQPQISSNDGNNQPSNKIVDEDTLDQDQPVAQVTDATSPAIQGEQSVSGTTPNVDSDDDTLANAHAGGFQPDEDLEHPKELDAGRDIDKSEEKILNS